MNRLNGYLIFGSLMMIFYNFRGYFKYVLKIRISKREEEIIENMLFPNLYKWGCILSNILCIITLTYSLIVGLTDISFKSLLISVLFFVLKEMLQVAQKRKSVEFKNSIVMILFYGLISLIFIYMLIN